MKKYFIFAASALALAGCSSDDYLGSNPGNENGENTAINFGGAAGKITRAGDKTGADAAKLLGNKFIVAGFKGAQSTDGLTNTPVFDHYTVEWTQNTAGTTDDNTSDWHYVGLTPGKNLSKVNMQSIKYWDYASGQYDFIAFSTGAAKLNEKTEDIPTGDNDVTVKSVTPDEAKTKAYTMAGTKEALAKCYIADLVTAYNNPTQDGKQTFKDEVKFTFRNLASKVRVALYETIPGYSVQDVKFYAADNDNVPETTATLYTSDNSCSFYDKGTATVAFPTVGTVNIKNTDYNKAHVTIVGAAEDEGVKTRTFGNLKYSAISDTDVNLNGDFLGTSSNKATYAGESDHYTNVFPNETGTTLTLRVDYTLVANDGSGEKITVHSAKAIIPAKYAQWISNYAYTYIFKISDNTNGKTGDNDSPEGLFPITFDAVVADTEEGSHSTITTVATPSITTYQKGHDVNNDEYAAGKDIYVMVHNDKGLANDLNVNGKAAIYTVTKENNAKVVITEATVHDALTIGTSTDVNGNVTGRNGIKLEKGELNANITSIRGVLGNNGADVTVTAGEAAMFHPAAGTYAFVYDTTPENATAGKSITSAVVLGEGKDLTGYFTDEACTIAASGKSKEGVIYYKNITNNGKTFAIKVIKVVAGN